MRLYYMSQMNICFPGNGKRSDSGFEQPAIPPPQQYTSPLSSSRVSKQTPSVTLNQVMRSLREKLPNNHQGQGRSHNVLLPISEQQVRRDDTYYNTGARDVSEEDNTGEEVRRNEEVDEDSYIPTEDLSYNPDEMAELQREYDEQRLRNLWNKLVSMYF